MNIFFRSSVFYFIIIIFEKLFNFLITPLISNNISIIALGEYSLYLTFESILMPILTLNLYTNISREFHKKSFSINEELSQMFITYFFSLCFWLLVLWSCYSYFSSFVHLSKQTFFFALLNSLLMSIIVFIQTFFKFLNKLFYFGIYSFLYVLLFLSSSYILVKSNLFSLPLMILVRSIILVSIILIFLFKTRIVISKIRLSNLFVKLRLLFPTVIHSLTSLIFVMSDRLLISNILGEDKLGNYTLSYQVAALFSMITSAMNAAWMPWLSENFHINTYKSKIQIVRLTYVLILLLFLVLFIYYLCIPIVFKILFQHYNLENIINARVLILGFFWQGIYFLISPYTLFIGKTKINAYIGIFVSICAVVSNLVFLEDFNILGASIVFASSWFVFAILYLFAVLKLYSLPWLKVGDLVKD